MTARRTGTVPITPEQDTRLGALRGSGHVVGVDEAWRAALRRLERVWAAAQAHRVPVAAEGAAPRA